MSSRPNLKQLRHQVLADGINRRDWRATSEVVKRLDVSHSADWYRVALILERLVVDGRAEIEKPGAYKRRFRKAA